MRTRQDPDPHHCIYIYINVFYLSVHINVMWIFLSYYLSISFSFVKCFTPSHIFSLFIIKINFDMQVLDAEIRIDRHFRCSIRTTLSCSCCRRVSVRSVGQPATCPRASNPWTMRTNSSPTQLWILIIRPLTLILPGNCRSAGYLSQGKQF